METLSKWQKIKFLVYLLTHDASSKKVDNILMMLQNYYKIKSLPSKAVEIDIPVFNGKTIKKKFEVPENNN